VNWTIERAMPTALKITSPEWWVWTPMAMKTTEDSADRTEPRIG
jgi:hypothetical protein